jgi:hypothetical protein
VTQYKPELAFRGKLWSSAHEAAVEAAEDLFWRFRPECGDPGETLEDRVYAVLASEVEKEHAAAVARYCFAVSPPDSGHGKIPAEYLETVLSTTRAKRELTERRKLILIEMFAMGAVGSTRKTTRDEVVQRIDRKKTGADFARDFGALKEAGYTDSGAGPEGGVWLTGKGKKRAEELNKESEQ